MKLETRSEFNGIETISSVNCNVLTNVKKTYKGSKIVRVQNVVQETQADALDRKVYWELKKEQRRNRRRGVN